MLAPTWVEGTCVTYDLVYYYVINIVGNISCNDLISMQIVYYL